MSFYSFNKRLFARLYRANISAKAINFPQSAAYSLIAFFWMINALSIIFLAMGLLKIKLKPGMIYLFLAITVAMLVVSYFTFLHKEKYKAIIVDTRFRKSTMDKLLLLALFLGSIILLVGISVYFGKTLFRHESVQVSPNEPLTCNHKILELCFEKAPPLIDSVNHYTGGLNDTNENGYYLLVFGLYSGDTLSLLEQAKSKGFDRLPIKSGQSFPIIDNYYDNCRNGFFKITKDRDGMFTRIEIINFEQMRFIIFQFGG